MSKIKSATLSLLFIFCTTAFAQKTEQIRIAFYNVENLFDWKDDSTIVDEEYTPEGSRYWSQWRYTEKLNRMAKAILSIGEWEAPAIVGLAEIENKGVLIDLIESPTLSKFHYGIVHYESPDRRGIDVGMIYRTDLFKPFYSKNIKVKLDNNSSFKTRDILYVRGIALQDTLHLMYCHWPSRYGGQQQSEPRRIQAAKTAKAVVDSIWKVNPNANIIIAGDFNDEWDNVSLAEYLDAQKEIDNTPNPQLINLMAKLNPNKGSHRYKGTWSYLDQIIVSKNLLSSNKPLHVLNQKAEVYDADFLLEQDEKYPGVKPFRTFIGLKYNGGFSDHLPVYIDLKTLP